MEHQIIYFNKDIYKITKIKNQFIYINKLQIDNKLILKADKLDFYDKFNIDDNIFYHYTDNIDKKVKFKIMKDKLINYTIINDVNDVYLFNSKLEYNYNSSYWFLDKWKYQSIYYIKYYLQLFTDKEIKIHHKEFRDNEIELFIFTFIGKNKEDLDIIESLGYTDIFLKLKEEAEIIYFKDNEEVKNECCPVCFSDEVKIYKNFYKCSHPICYECFLNWCPVNGCRNCPICRALMK